MATGQTQEELSTCSICCGQFISPRKLPGCSHIFCENCLLTYMYITNLEPKDKNSREFHCPNCRRQIPLPETNGDLPNWVKSLEVLITDDTMASNASSKETDSNALCVSCKDEEALVSAEKYCVDCGEILCSKCSRIGHRANFFRSHTIIDLQTVQEQQKNNKNTLYALSEYLKCSEHPNKYVSVVCMDENMLCCTECIIENHRHCETFEKLESLSSKSENKSTETKTKQRIEDVMSQIKDLIEFKKQSGSENVAEVNKKAEMLKDTVEELRTKINTLFDVLEECITSKGKAISKKCGMEVEEGSSKLKDISNTLVEYLTVIDHAVKVASDNQTYVILRKLAVKIEESAGTVSKACHSCGKYVVDLKIKPTLQTLCNLGTNDVDQLAEVTGEIEKTPSSSVAEKVRCFQRGVEEVAKHKILPQNTEWSEYYGIVYTRDARATQRMFLVSSTTHMHSSFCCSVDNNYKVTEQFNTKLLTGIPYGLTELRQNVIAVGLPKEKKIVFLSENEGSKRHEIVGHVTTKFQPKALCGLSNGDVAVSYDEPVGFGVLKFRCSFYAHQIKERIYFTKDKSGRLLKTFDFMAVDEKRSHIIQPCTQEKAVYCFDFEGNPKFKYSHADLHFPRGVSISREGNILVCDQKKSVIHIISPSGQVLNVVREGCPEWPLAIAFDQSGLQFAVTCNSNWYCGGGTIRFFRLI